ALRSMSSLSSSCSSASTAISTLSLHDALPICEPFNGGRDHARRIGRRDGGAETLEQQVFRQHRGHEPKRRKARPPGPGFMRLPRSEEHTSELQSRENLVCRLLLEKKKQHANSH